MAKAGRPSVYKASARSVNFYLTDDNIEYLVEKAEEHQFASPSALLNQILLQLRKKETISANLATPTEL